MNDKNGITADAIAIQERDGFRSAGWIKLIAPAKVNLFLGIGEKRPDGYHNAQTVMHSLALHDVIYLRKKTSTDESYGTNKPTVSLIPSGGFTLPTLSDEDNLASKAVLLLQESLKAPDDMCDVMIRIEKNIPFQGGLGGASTDAAATLLGMAHLNDIVLDHPALKGTARSLGADVPFFLQGGCAYFEGVGDVFVHSLKAASNPLVLVKPQEGVSTSLAYRTFDSDPLPVDPLLLHEAESATAAIDVPLFNNLTPAAEALLPQLKDINSWLIAQNGVTNALLCGSGATTFALCDSMEAALKIVADARRIGLWARATTLSSIGARQISTNGQKQ